jgi:hypothetical protein
MLQRISLNAAAGIVLMAITAVEAATIEGMPGSPPVIPQESRDRFLGGVRPYGDGRPSPNILYSTGGIAEATNSPEAASGPSVTSTGTPPEHPALSGGALRGGTLERRTNTPYVVQPGTLERRTVTPVPVQSPWR